MVSAQDDESVFQLTGLLEPFEQDPDVGVNSLTLAQVVCHVFADLWDVWQEGWKFALQRVRFDSPERLARALDPSAVGVGGAEIIKPRLLRFRVGEKGVEITPNFGIDRFLCLQEGCALLDELRHGCRKLVRSAARLFVRETLSAKRSICG